MLATRATTVTHQGRDNTSCGEGDYEVREGDCLTSVAAEHGFLWQTLWNLPENVELKRIRKLPNVLLPGDRLTIPPLRQKAVAVATGRRHHFRRRGVPAMLRLRFYDDGQPRAREPYLLNIDGHLRSGTLGDEGDLTEPIPPNAVKAELRIGEDQDLIILDLGMLHPVTERSGVQGRLNNLGFQCGPTDGKLGQKTSAALRRFQEHHGLTVTGEPDRATRDKLVELHGC